jgi:hypothetical protein
VREGAQTSQARLCSRRGVGGGSTHELQKGKPSRGPRPVRLNVQPAFQLETRSCGFGGGGAEAAATAAPSSQSSSSASTEDCAIFRRGAISELESIPPSRASACSTPTTERRPDRRRSRTPAGTVTGRPAPAATR